MANEASNPLAKYLHHLSSAARMESLPDRELVERFATQREEDAFAALVRRHGPMVLRVCQRVLHDSHDAEDVFQATFLVLSRKAASLRCADAVGCFLHGIAYRLAQKARTQRTRQQKHESQAAIEKQVDDPLAELSVREAQGILDEELARLPEKYRAPLLLCCLEGRTRDEAARQLGWSVKLVKSRLEQGRERLHARLTRRGLTLPAALLAALLTEEAATAAVPALLLRAAIQTATAAPSAGIAPSIALLAESALHGVLTVKAKVAVGLLLLAGALTAGVAAIAPSPSPFPLPLKGNKEGVREPAERPAAAKAPETPKAEQLQPARTLRVVVLDPQGKPLPDAKVHSGIWTHEKGFKANHDYQTDAAGVAHVELPKTFYILRLWTSKKPFVTLFAGWEQEELASGNRLPDEYTIRLESAVTAGGRIVDEQGKPIAGAKIQVKLAGDPKPAYGDSHTRYNTSLVERDDAATTDAEGRWHIDNVPDNAQAKLIVGVSHPDFIYNPRWQDAQRAAGVTTAMLRQETATLTLKRGVRVSGRVTAPNGKPIEDALVVYGDRTPYFARMPHEFPTDADGRFHLPALAAGDTTLTVIAHRWAPQLRRIKLWAGMQPQDFRMTPGKPIRLRIVDVAGKPVPKAYVRIIGWKGSESLLSSYDIPNHPKVPDPKIPQRANADGIWEWTWAPDDAVKLKIELKGFAECELEIAGGAAERKVVLKPEHRILGRVTDAATGKPIAAFTVVPLDVFSKDFIHAERIHAEAGKNGRLDYWATRTDIPLRLRIEALGYRTQDGPEFRVGDDTPRTQDFRLQPSQPIAGVVLDMDGKPVTKAEVLLATPTEAARIQSNDGNHKTITDSAGRFAFPDPGAPCLVVAQANAGFARAELPTGRHDAGTLRLRAWASIRGQFRDGGQPVRGATIFLSPIRLDTLDQPRLDTTMLQTKTDPDGRFEFPRVPPIPVRIWPHLGPWEDEGFRSGPSVPLDLKPGQRADLNLGDGGTIVKGKVKLAGKVPANLDCTYALNYLVERAPGLTPPPAIARLGFDARDGWQDAWSQTQEGESYLHTLRHWFVKLAADGTFRISGVPPGEYDLTVAVYAKPDG